MSHALFFVRQGDDLLPRHPSPPYKTLAYRGPSPLVEKWLRAPAATAFRRVDLSRVVTSGLGYNLFVHEPRNKWQQAYFEVNDDVASLRHAQKPLAALGLEVDNRTLAKIDNWAALVPLDHVLLTFDDLFDHPASPAVNAQNHEVEAFVLMLLDLGLVPHLSSTACSAPQLAALSTWLSLHCATAVELFQYAYTHIYVNARETAGSTEAWHDKLAALRFPSGESGSGWVLYVRHLAGHFPRAARIFEGDYFTSFGPLDTASFVELYVKLHPEPERLCLNATSTNRTPRLARLDSSLAKYEPGARSSRASVFSSRAGSRS